MTKALVMYAEEEEEYLPDPGNYTQSWNSAIIADPQHKEYGHALTTARHQTHWVHPAYLQEVMRRFRVQRKYFYCPSNPTLDTDDNWQGRADPAGVQASFTITGYAYLSGRAQYDVKLEDEGVNDVRDYRRLRNILLANGGVVVEGFEEIPLGYRYKIMSRRLSEAAFYDQVAVDFVRFWNGSFQQGIGEQTVGLPNHIADVTRNSTAAQHAELGMMPEGRGGCNVSYKDGHVTWTPQKRLGQRVTAASAPTVISSNYLNETGYRRFKHTNYDRGAKYWW